MRAGTIAVALLVASVLAGCLGSEGEPKDAPSNSSSISTERAITVWCEGIETRPGWRREATHVEAFGLLAVDLRRTAHRNRNGDYSAKMGAVVVGGDPVTLRVSQTDRDRVRLAYGDVNEHTQLAEAPTEVTFMPCPGLPRSGYVGGLLLDSVSSPVKLEVAVSGDGIETLTIPPSA